MALGLTVENVHILGRKHSELCLKQGKVETLIFEVNNDSDSPKVFYLGWTLNNKKGQCVLHLNSGLSGSLTKLSQGEKGKIAFNFKVPYILPGDYTISVSLNNNGDKLDIAQRLHDFQIIQILEDEIKFLREQMGYVQIPDVKIYTPEHFNKTLKDERV